MCVCVCVLSKNHLNSKVQAKTCTGSHYIVLNFYQINKDGEIRTRDHLVIKALIPCQKKVKSRI